MDHNWMVLPLYRIPSNNHAAQELWIAKFFNLNEELLLHRNNSIDSAYQNMKEFAADSPLLLLYYQQLNIANPATGCQKTIEFDDERKTRIFYDKRISAEVAVDSLGDEFKGYVFRITGGNDKQGFPMKQGVLLPSRVRLLLSKGHSCYRPRRTGERKRKSVRGCIVGSDMSVLSVAIVKQGEQDLPGLTDTTIPKRLGPKRANKIRKFFNLSKEDDVRKFVIRREVQPKNPEKKPYTKAPKIQRLVTPIVLQRKRHRLALKKRRAENAKEAEAEYKALLAKRVKEAAEKRQEIKKRRASSLHKA